MNSCEPYDQLVRDAAWCPGAVRCSGNMTQVTVGLVPAYIAIVSSSLSCISSILIVFTFVMWKDIRSGSRTVITFLAVADFFTALGYILGSINHLLHYDRAPGSPHCVTFSVICQIQSFITSWSSVSSFIWTSALALYLYLTLVKSRIFLAQGLMTAFHVVGWGFPILFCLPLLAAGKLGFSPYAASTWCFISQNIAKTYDDRTAQSDVYLYFLGGKLWEIAAYVIVIVFYALIKIHIRQQTSGNTASQKLLTAGFVDVVKKADRKLTLIPVVFVLLRMWGTLQFFFSLAVQTECGCVSKSIGRAFTFFGIIQAIGDGGQGWGNFVLYILASGKIRRRLLSCCCVFCCYTNKKHAPTPPPPLLLPQDKRPKRKEPGILQRPATGHKSINQYPSVYDTHPTAAVRGGGASDWTSTPPPVNVVVHTHEPTTDFEA